MRISEEATLPLNYEDQSLSRAVRELRPVIYRDGGSFRCLLGPDIEAGITGTGESPEAAIESWTQCLRQRLETVTINDEVAQYAKDVLNTSVNNVW